MAGVLCGQRVRTCLTMVSWWIGTVALGLIWCVWLSCFVRDVSGETIADSCRSLLDAFLDRREATITIRGNLECTKAREWSESLSIERDVLVVGDVFGESTLAFPDMTRLLVTSKHFLTFRHMLLVVHVLDDGITLPFIDIEDGAEVFIENSAIISESCEGLEVSNSGRIVIDGDVGVLNAAGNEIVHSCNTAHICERDDVMRTTVVHSIELASNRSECRHGGFSLNADSTSTNAGSESESESESDSDSLSSAVMLATVLTTTLFGILVVVLITVVILLILRRKATFEDRTGFTERSETKFIPMSSRDVPKQNSSDRSIVPRTSLEGRLGMVSDQLALGNTNFKLSDIEIGEHLGRGSFGKVYKGYWQGSDVAVKCIVHGRSIVESRNEPFEAFLSRQVSHPNVVQTFIVHTVPMGGAAPVRNEALAESVVSEVEHRDSNNGSIMSTDDMFGSLTKGPAEHEGNSLETWIVLEYCDRGSLARCIREGAFLTVQDGERRPNIVNVILTALDVAHAMMYLHNVRIVHGDLKAENVLLKSDVTDPRGFVCKVGDFGLSRFLAEDTHIETFTCGTITHMPPELLKGGVLTPAADVYSFAILMWELLTGTNPYGKKTHAEIVLIVVSRQKRPSIPDYCSDGYAELLEDCWRQSHLERPGFPEVVDRLRDLLEEETANRIDMDGASSRPDSAANSGGKSSRSMEHPSFPSCQPMSYDYGWTTIGTNDASSRDPDFLGDLDMHTSSHADKLSEARTLPDLDLDGQCNRCFMMSTEPSSEQETLERG